MSNRRCRRSSGEPVGKETGGAVALLFLRVKPRHHTTMAGASSPPHRRLFSSLAAAVRRCNAVRLPLPPPAPCVSTLYVVGLQSLPRAAPVVSVPCWLSCAQGSQQQIRQPLLVCSRARTDALHMLDEMPELFPSCHFYRMHHVVRYLGLQYTLLLIISPVATSIFL
ncbi:hypothetical protein GUJ93_ZPchr0002g26324 [Zizania palustris]|uniref:Uncharacterized protein n=1 Tax=Zizania palustris TaxID=103762 RepID=A0A8J5RU02_ZIZPA|nr:hypothetical protein GUJ93_ZPchr0002g26324 [Zizania palustris]